MRGVIFSTLIFSLPTLSHAQTLLVQPLKNGETVVVLRQTEIIVNKTANPAVQELWMYFSLPPKLNSQTPLVLVLPIMGGQNLWIERQFAGALNSRGFAAAIVVLPQQFERRYFLSLPSGFLFLERDPRLVAMNFRQALNDLRFILDWAQEGGLGQVRPGWEPSRYGILGTSLGAITGSMAMARDERLKAGAFLLGGADPAMIITQSRETKKIASRLGVQYEDLAKKMDAINLVKLAEEKGPNPLWNNRPIFLVHAIWDRVIPKAAREALSRSMPHAKIKKIYAGHMTAIFYISSIKKQVASFFEESFNKQSE